MCKQKAEESVTPGRSLGKAVPARGHSKHQQCPPSHPTISKKCNICEHPEHPRVQDNCRCSSKVSEAQIRGLSFGAEIHTDANTMESGTI